jgi:hypothetical protein
MNTPISFHFAQIVKETVKNIKTKVRITYPSVFSKPEVRNE